jgi:hypothetical protein
MVILKENPKTFKTNKSETAWVVIKSWDGKKMWIKFFCGNTLKKEDQNHLK